MAGNRPEQLQTPINNSSVAPVHPPAARHHRVTPPRHAHAESHGFRPHALAASPPAKTADGETAHRRSFSGSAGTWKTGGFHLIGKYEPAMGRWIGED